VRGAPFLQKSGFPVYLAIPTMRDRRGIERSW
jgi:hypothetical protein